ncbi:hypothetical protein CSQ93_28330 [Janthinobacterium sp. BJB426]|nr:hypothetical protein CSQ93_28330 [Janthinobacterium sp. BJB426]
MMDNSCEGDGGEDGVAVRTATARKGTVLVLPLKVLPINSRCQWQGNMSHGFFLQAQAQPKAMDKRERPRR